MKIQRVLFVQRPQLKTDEGRNRERRRKKHERPRFAEELEASCRKLADA